VAEAERCNDIINRASVQFFHDGTDGETAAKMLTVLNEAKPCELCGGLALGQENCDAAYDELRVDCDELRADVVRLTAERDRLRAEVERLHRAAGIVGEAFGKAEAELATERARLDSGTILLTVAGERVWHCGVDLRAAIDAAMKEGK
jgi:cell division protein FtsB